MCDISFTTRTGREGWKRAYLNPTRGAGTPSPMLKTSKTKNTFINWSTCTKTEVFGYYTSIYEPLLKPTHFLTINTSIYTVRDILETFITLYFVLHTQYRTHPFPVEGMPSTVPNASKRPITGSPSARTEGRRLRKWTKRRLSITACSFSNLGNEAGAEVIYLPGMPLFSTL